MIEQFLARIDKLEQLIDDGFIQCNLEYVRRIEDGIEITFLLKGQTDLGEAIDEAWLLTATELIDHALSFGRVLPHFTSDHPRLRHVLDNQATLMYSISPKDVQAFEYELFKTHNEAEHGPFSHTYSFPDLGFGVGQIASGCLSLLKKYETILNRHSMRPSLLFVRSGLSETMPPTMMLQLDWSWDWFTENFVIAKNYEARLVE